MADPSGDRILNLNAEATTDMWFKGLQSLASFSTCQTLFIRSSLIPFHSPGGRQLVLVDLHALFEVNGAGQRMVISSVGLLQPPLPLWLPAMAHGLHSCGRLGLVRSLWAVRCLVKLAQLQQQ